MGKKYYLKIPGKLDALNDYINANRTARMMGSKMKKGDEAIVCGYVLQQLRGVHIEKRLSVCFVWYEPTKRRDPDNIAGFGHKVIFDALVDTGVLENDGWNYIGQIQDLFFLDKDNPRILVIMEEMDEGETPLERA